jgi:hypothetical protein
LSWGGFLAGMGNGGGIVADEGAAVGHGLGCDVEACLGGVAVGDERVMFFQT